MWRKAKTEQKHWRHTQAKLVGAKDTAVCKLCQITVDLEQPPRTRESVLLEFTRKHFYKHKLDYQGDSYEQSQS